MGKCTGKPNGRPTDYNEDIANEILIHLSNGGSLASFCLPEGRPSRPTIYYWMDKHEDFARRYQNAQRHKARALFDEMVDISEDLEKYDTNRARLIIETRRIYAERACPEEFQPSQRVNAEHEVMVTSPEWIEKKDEQ